MTRPKSGKRTENDALVTDSLSGIANKRFKTCYTGAKSLGIHCSTVTQINERTTPPPASYESNDPEIPTGPRPDECTVQSINTSLNVKIAAAALPSPTKHDVHQVSKIAKYLHAETATLHWEFAEMNTVKERESGKHKILNCMSSKH